MAKGTARVDHSGTITDVDPEMPERRRSSLIDQLALAAASQQFMEGISEGEIEDGVLPSDDNETVGETEMVFNTELADASNEYSIDLAASQGDESVSMIDFSDTDAGSNEMDFETINKRSLGLSMGGAPEASFRARPSFISESMNQPPINFDSLMYGPGEGGLSRSSSVDAGLQRRGSRAERRRPLSISVPGAGPQQQRRTSNRIIPLIEETSKPAHSDRSSIFNLARRASRKASLNTGSSGSDAFGSAIEKLKNNDSNSEWESVAAAVAVVQEGERRGTDTNRSRLNQYSAGDTVLVFLTLLNVTNSEDPKDTFTIAAVNKFGYPEGEGKTEDEKRGPYNFVLATVKQLHFEEDDRYYTVIRADTGSEQRADSGWMEPLTDPAGQEAALRAAKKTIRSQSNDNIELAEDGGFVQDLLGRIADALVYPAFFFTHTFVPGYRKLRLTTKARVSQLLYGDSPFACRVRVTGINFLVLCSLIFLFLEVANLAFFPPDYDREISLVVVVAWGFLVIELFLEIMIRPPDYTNLMDSDKAFAPSTARHISFFHIFFEGISLATFLPELWCTFVEAEICYKKALFSRARSTMDAVLGHSPSSVMIGRTLMGITAVRFFGVVRHWKQALINDTYQTVTDAQGRKRLMTRPSAADSISSLSTALSKIKKNKKKDDDLDTSERRDEESKQASSEEDERLKNAATIGTALMVVNSQRALVLLTSIVLILPILVSRVKTNSISTDLTRLLQSNNVQAMETDDCDFLKSAVDSWLNMAMVPQPESSFVKPHEDTYVLWAQLLPVRCDWQREDGVITYCDNSTGFREGHTDVCELWDDTLQLGIVASDQAEGLEERMDMANRNLAEEVNLRIPAIQFKCLKGLEGMPCYADSSTESELSVTVYYNNNPTVSLANTSLFFLLLGILMLGLYSLQALRSDAIRLVLDPLQRMLKIVLQYADNPLSHNVMKSSSNDDDFVLEKDAKEIGNYETEQLISAITKIADLLRKCWGIAGAGIISSNLARTVDGKTVVFNPTVPGKRVYALFGFVAIGGFSDQLRRLDRDVMILINDVARVVHDEVYRWALGDHGQCNKNLGPAFLMVFRIGDFSEVHKKKQVATEKLFRSNKGKRSGKTSKLRNRRRSNRSGTRRANAGDAQIDLASLPGIQGFTDRALLGMLKSFAGIHRDKNLYIWQSDFRLSDGVGNYNVDIIYGMDAGWAVEGAVGSEYKIDATYLSPHVNMASRMMSATKQYGVTILLSKAVEELLSKNCRKKLRHLDTVYVKGSNVKQQIFTYDARHEGVDFFLIERSPSQADIDAEAYTPNIWDHDQDVKAMRQHISDEFVELYSSGVKEYLAGDWVEAYKLLEQADNKLIEHIIDEGYIEIDPDEFPGDIFDRSNTNEELVRLRHDLGDGACRVLMSYMKSRNLTAPADWDGVRKLSSK